MPRLALLARLPEALRQAIELRGEGDFAGLAGVLVERGGAVTLAPRLAAGDGPLLPLLVETAEAGRYPLYRLLCERVLSINTTAAGGNTTLMTLGA